MPCGFREPVQMAASLEDVYNFRQADERIATSGQPSEPELAAICAAGYTVVINLALHDDPRYSLADEPGVVRGLGMTYVHIPVQFGAPTSHDLVAFFDAMDRYRDHKIWVHCAANKRVSTFMALYRVLRRGWPRDAAFSLQHDIWEPNEVWRRFVQSVLD